MKRFPGAKDFSKRQRTKKKARKSIRHNIIDKRGRRIFNSVHILPKDLVTLEIYNNFSFHLQVNNFPLFGF